MDDDFIKIEADFKFESAQLTLVTEMETEVFQGKCSTGSPIVCALSSINESIILQLSGREHNVIGVIEQPRGIRTKLLCVN